MIGSIADVKYWVSQNYAAIDENVGGYIIDINNENLHNDNHIVTYKMKDGSTQKFLFETGFDLLLYFTQQDNKIYWEEDGKPNPTIWVNGDSSKDKVHVRVMSKDDIKANEIAMKMQAKEEKERIARKKAEQAEKESQESEEAVEEVTEKKSKKSTKKDKAETEEVSENPAKQTSKKTREVSYTPVATNKQMKWSKFVEASGLDEDTLIVKLQEVKIVKKDGDFSAKFYKEGYVKEDGETLTKEGLAFINEALA